MGANPQLPPVVAANELAALVRAGADLRLLDVRTPGEFETAHIRGAYNVPLDTLGEHGDDIRLHVDTPVVLVCQSGSRARRADEALRLAGMPNLHVLDGGVNGWLGGGQPLERGKERLTLERQVRILAGLLAATGGILALLVTPLFALLPAVIGGGLVFAGITDTCGMAILLSRLPYNRPVGCDVGAMVEALKTGRPPTGLRRADAPPATSCSA